ncbi:UDP-glucuronosyl/UDP-glucosyltransferase [Macleaya cordata]|uniref:Glycosyltransferase n=1 Tax=Macleaya cordata TaxID=56857 RepID=A0A200R8H2_MACCD|nr:UDP-glucuronosyl/UDP-glucosyltransferase [Macleaya cordata]
MDSETHHHQLHGFFFPLMAYGHMIPAVDLARMFAARGVKATIVTTPLNASILSNSINRDRSSGLDIDIQTLRFPAVEAGLPEGSEHVNAITSIEMIAKFFKAVNMLQQPLEQLLEEHHPDFIVADMFLPWATEAAGKFGIPRFVFHGTNYFCQCVEYSLKCYKPYEGITSDKETFVVPGLPDKIEMTRSQLSNHFKVKSEFNEWLDQIRDSELRSYGVLVNSFYELEPAYAEHYTNVMGRRAWHIGPVSLQNRDTIDKAQRGKKASIDEHHVLNWLDSKEPNSVIYVCFGSASRISGAQLLEIAMGLEDSGFSFVWVIRTIKKEEEERFLPEGFEERMEGKGLIIREWAPQVLILDHPAVGGFITHCGWNSILEGISAGVPMITWPMFAEQFYNENLVTQVLKIGIPVGVEEWNLWIEAKEVSVRKDKIGKVVTQLMGDGEAAENTRKKAKELSEMAKRAVEEGGSSYADFTALIEELKIYRK